MKKQWFKQATAILMAMVLAVSCPLLSLAADTIPEETMTFYVRAENDAGTILPRTKVTMKASDHKALSEYGVQGTPPEIAYITPMEVFCYALAQYTGGEYTTADLKLGSGGWISDFFGAGAPSRCCFLHHSRFGRKCQSRQARNSDLRCRIHHFC